MARYLNHIYRLTLEVPTNLPGTEASELSDGEDKKVVIEGLQIVGSVKLDKKSSSNMLKLNIYNLTKESIDIIAQENLQVRLEVGYPEQPLEELFNGGMIQVSTRPSGGSGVDKITTITASDGYSAVRDSQTSRTWTQKGITVEDIIKDLVLLDLKLAIGNIHNGNLAPGKGLTHKFPTYSAVGPTYKMMDDITSGFDLEWNIHMGKVDVYPKGSGRSFTDKIPVFSPTTGLLRSPNKVIIHPDRVTGSKDKKTGKSFEVILNPTLQPGGSVKIDSADIKEEVTLKEVVHEFNYWQGKWVSKIITEDK